ncbi:hypothetical protein [Phenylobacterium sp. 58.2.17]|uniref:hypothetical protein n=1 Tax=Phenylobacterium sp. 58.2.17 TaxID=2969306 RepID=UPI002263EA8C|nr:hypothetical protein [Phenylobacterium sp. 58.2.17]MCX7586575.1 hypothetical protein [Phenylobacterium sp. 58.2.17]
MARVRGDDQTGDLFGDGSIFPVRKVAPMRSASEMKLDLATAMGMALRTCGDTGHVIAAKMSELLGDEKVTTAQLYAYTAPSRSTHTISVVRFMAFVRATGCHWLLDHLIRDEGAIILHGEEALLAESAIKAKQARELMAQSKAALALAPSTPEFRKQR